MYTGATVGALGTFLFLTAASGQVTTDWRQIGNSVVDLGLAGLASGPVNRVWYSADGSILYLQTPARQVFQTADLERWQPSTAVPPPAAPAYLQTYPDPPLVGSLRDLAVAPENPEEIAVATDAGVFRSADGGKSWTGMNDGLPNLPVERILNVPSGTQGLRVALPKDQAIAWPPGTKQAWLPTDNSDVLAESALRKALSAERGSPVTALAQAGDLIYAGMQNGEIDSSSDGGITWSEYALAGSGRIERLWLDPANPRTALAAVGASPANPFSLNATVHVLHTMNSGAFWDNFTANLPDVPAHGVAADPASGAIYVATDSGVYIAYTDLTTLGAAPAWTQLTGLPAAPAMDVKLDAQGNQLFAAVSGDGVYATLAPHRLRDPKVVSAADFVARAAAPGTVLTILGAQAGSVRAGDLTVPVLAATSNESQIQVPFEATGGSLSLSANVAGKNLAFPSMPLTPAAPAIFAGTDGAPLVLDADTGLMLDAMTPAHSGSRVQILATGLGRVTPDWPTGLPAPLENPPRVSATVSAYLDRVPVEVTRATLAPGYVGFYLIEITVPRIVNYGPEELYVEAGGASSNRVRLYIEP